MSSDESYSEGIIRKRNDAVKALYDRYAPALLGLCCRYCNSREDAEDVLHEGFMKILKSLPSFRERNPGSLLAWMKRIMVNTALNHIRSRNRDTILKDISGEKGDEDPQKDPGFFENLIGKISKERILEM